MVKHIGIGLMSGTSLDGIDAVLVEIEQVDRDTNVHTLSSLFQPYSDELRQRLLQLCSPDTANIEHITSMNMYLGREYARIVEKLIGNSGVKHEDILFVSSHGQTIYHKPTGTNDLADVPGTLQIGDLSVLSELTGLPVVGDFRTADMAAGGQGAPLISFIDYILFRDENKSRAIQNIGGIGNVTFLPKGAAETEIISFDTGPGNMVIDAVVYHVTDGKQTYDKDGLIAASGNIHAAFLEQLMSHPYFALTPPKTTGRELFNKHFVDEVMESANQIGLSNEDLVATVTAWTAQTISDSYSRFLETEGRTIDEVIIGGGGSYNPYLLEQLRKNLPGKIVSTHENFAISSDLKEAIGFAILGYHCLLGQYNQLPSATGAGNSVIMGKIAYTQPQAFQRLLSLWGN